MADNTQIKWLYPPNFIGTYDSHIKNGVKRHTILCTNLSDGTGEDDAIKLKRTDLLTPSGATPSMLVIEKIWYHVAGLSVTIGYNNENDEEVVRLYSGDGNIDFTSVGGFVPAREEDGEVPEGGDIVFSTDDETSGDSYTIMLTVRLKD